MTDQSVGQDKLRDEVELKTLWFIHTYSKQVSDSVIECITQLIEAEATRREQALLDAIRSWVKWNKHDMGELGEFIRTQYVYNKLDELRCRAAEAGDES